MTFTEKHLEAIHEAVYQYVENTEDVEETLTPSEHEELDAAREVLALLDARLAAWAEGA
jgi:hypothetical protein